MSEPEPLKRKRLYTTWCSMRRRVYCKTDKHFKYYGGKGVTICEKWHSFPNFQEWALKNGYKDNLTIERKDPNGNYEPSNCEWITREENSSRVTTRSFLKYTCRRGHAWTKESSYFYFQTNRKGKSLRFKLCTICSSASKKQWKLNRKLQRLSALTPDGEE